jgi:hypothetical protein
VDLQRSAALRFCEAIPTSLAPRLALPNWTIMELCGGSPAVFTRQAGAKMPNYMPSRRAKTISPEQPMLSLGMLVHTHYRPFSQPRHTRLQRGSSWGLERALSRHCAQQSLKRGTWWHFSGARRFSWVVHRIFNDMRQAVN